jgi:hypothetical protein
MGLSLFLPGSPDLNLFTKRTNTFWLPTTQDFLDAGGLLGLARRARSGTAFVRCPCQIDGTES